MHNDMGDQTVLTTLDKSNYLKGMLIVARLDYKLIEREKEIIRDVATRLGFSRDFYEDVLKNLMINENISDSPLMFSSPAITRIFLGEALQLACIDSELAPAEIDWLRKTAVLNQIDHDEFEKYVDDFLMRKNEEAA